MKHITELEKHGEKEKGELYLEELEHMLADGKIKWQSTPYYGSEEGQNRFIKNFFDEDEALLQLRPLKGSTLGKTGNIIWVIVKKGNALMRYFVNDVAEADYDRLFDKYGYEE